MLQSLSLEQEFLDKFTKEIILNLVKQIKEQEAFERELRRAEREVELEKMKKRFANYGAQQIQRQAVRQNNIIPQRQSMPQRIMPVQQPPRQPIPALPRVQAPPRIEIPPANIQAQQEDINFFGKIQALINDALVTYIECPGENKNIVIRRAGITTTTTINLTNPEELFIIKSFSEKARIPLIEGMLNARIANIEISAVVSETSGSSFIIKKNPVQIPSLMPSQLEKPMMQFPQPGSQFRQQAPPMPPVTRPFTPGAMPPQMPTQQFQRQPQQQNPGGKKESFWNKKITFGK